MRALRRVIGLGLMVMLAGCSRLGLIDWLTPDRGYHLVAGIDYGQGPRQQLDLYQPSTPLPAHPVVVFFYGGSWNSGQRGDYRFVAQALASRGILVAVADYRLYPQVRYPAFLDDNAQAVAWVYRHVAEYGGNPQRLFLMGHSSGAYNAAMLALDPARLAAVGLSPAIIKGWIGLAGPYDFLPVEDKEVRPVFFYPDSPVDSQPINHVQAGAPPALLLAANSDSFVNPVRNTGGLARRLREVGVPVRVRYFDHLNHATLVGAMAWPLAWLAPVRDEVVGFVSQ
ncbi:alpha/beta hydrolase [Pseudomonas sp. HR96]|uniref:alpha/beta hydrolase n=1 Tax=Pseudomonas sp. HR96 TaxID=1027966 RepID=UPI002A7555AE|nr:alpha/beta hydrolase [Pseudomonas sp. HR96]WPP00499.1 alpha/beta hydrolase [Pseudomonas sp. HR96]